jgi:hypothetical protein
MAWRIFSAIAYPTEYSTRRPRTWFWSVSHCSSRWEAPPPSARINNLLRWVAGICSIAAPRTSMSSAAVLAPALPGRRTAASSSVVL